MQYERLTDKEYNLIVALEKAMQELTHEAPTHSNLDDFFTNKDVTIGDIDSVIIDIKHDELYKAIGRYKACATSEVAHDTDGMGFAVVEILNGFYDWVFGYTEDSEEKTYYLCETKTFWNEEIEEDETHFFVGEWPVILNNCIKTDMGGM